MKMYFTLYFLSLFYVLLLNVWNISLLLARYMDQWPWIGAELTHLRF